MDNQFVFYLFMKLSREAGVLWMEWMFLFTLSSNDELAALSSFMLLQEKKVNEWHKNQQCSRVKWREEHKLCIKNSV